MKCLYLSTLDTYVCFFSSFRDLKKQNVTLIARLQGSEDKSKLEASRLKSVEDENKQLALIVKACEEESKLQASRLQSVEDENRRLASCLKNETEKNYFDRLTV